MGSEATGIDRTDAVQSRLEQYFENPSAANAFRDAYEAFKRGPAAVISKTFVAGLHPPKVESKLDMKGHWKDKPDDIFDLVRKVALEWRTVELADTQSHQKRAGRATPRRKPTSKQLAGKSAGRAVDKASTVLVTCFECRKPDHLARNCPLNIFPAKTSSQPAWGGAMA